LRTTSRPQLFFTDRGSGEPVLLITGWTISSAVFDPVAARYLPHVRVIAHDHRGTGRSATWLGPVSPALLAADAARVLDDCGVDSAHLVGLSMGAMVALELAIRMPHRVKSLALVGGGTGGLGTALPEAGRAARTVAAVIADSARHREPWPAAALFSDAFRAQHPAKVAEYVPAFGHHRAPPWAVGWQTLSVSCFARSASLHRVDAPTLVLHGGEDVMSPPANAELLARGIPGAELHVVPGAGHAVPLERPELTARLLLAWVARHAHTQPPPTTKRDALTERGPPPPGPAPRPFSLPAGALRNARALGRRG
jgi:pimeloyl-ACP methyl ester carboxylesterase